MKTLFYLLGRVYQYSGYHFTRGRVEQAQRLAPIVIHAAAPLQGPLTNEQTLH